MYTFSLEPLGKCRYDSKSASLWVTCCVEAETMEGKANGIKAVAEDYDIPESWVLTAIKDEAKALGIKLFPSL